MLDQLCPPALLYVAFSITQIIIDIFKNMYNTAFFKFIVMVIFTIVLNALCSRGLGVVSWMIVFIPFIMMTVITTLLLVVFGLSPATGGLDYKVDYPQQAQSRTVVVTNTGNSSNTNSTGTTADDYNPNDYTSGTPADINNYN